MRIIYNRIFQLFGGHLKAEKYLGREEFGLYFLLIKKKIHKQNATLTNITQTLEIF